MKLLIKKIAIPFLFLAGVMWSGCYTEVATRSYDGEYYDADVSSDTTVNDSNVTINNNYYLDDNYRQSRFRLSFNYYYPSYYHSSLIGSYYYSYFDDPYWGFGPRWSYFDYGYGCIYPRPYVYDPWWPYYGGYYHHYPIYYQHPIYGYNPPTVDPGNRRRADGPSRDLPNVRERSRPIPTPTSPSPTVASTPRVRESSPRDEGTTVAQPRRSRDEVPWWKRNEGTRNRESVNPPPAQNNPNKEARPAERKRENQRASVAPSRRNDAPQQQARPAQRQRENRQPSYSPPPQRSSSQPSYAPPASSGGGRSRSSEGSSGRRRD